MNRVRERREAAGLTQQQLAERAGLSLRALAYIEHGRDMKLSTLDVIARALGLSVAELLPGEREAAS